MRLKYKNDLFQFLQNSKLGVSKFELINAETEMKIKFQDSPFEFIIRDHPDDFDYFDYKYVRYAPGYPSSNWIPEVGYSSFVGLKNSLANWIDQDISNYLEDKQQPDLWEEFKGGNLVVNLEKINFEDKNAFSSDERKQIEMSINELKLLIHKNFNTTQEEQKLVNSRLDYLIESSNRLNKFDWKSVAVSTIISIATTLTLDTQKGRELFILFQKVFSVIPQLITG